MRRIGFSTGPFPEAELASLVDRFAGISVEALELSARRKKTLVPLIERLDELDLGSVAHLSIHAPKQFRSPTEAEAAEMLSVCIERGWPVVIHPDAIGDPSLWSAFGPLLAIENMDARKGVGRTVEEMREVLALLPEASVCIDVAHASHIDPSLRLARSLVVEFRSRLSRIHLSEIDAFGAHLPLRASSAGYYRALLQEVPESVPILLETPVPLDCLPVQLERARECFRPASQGERGFRREVDTRVRERRRAQGLSRAPAPAAACDDPGDES